MAGLPGSRASVSVGPPLRWSVPFNWKLGAENFAGDSYHTPHTHASVVDIGLFRNDYTELLLARKPNEAKWRLPGGFVDPLGESFEQAALRETKEESGLDVELLGERPPTTGPGTRALIGPRFLDIHRINETHEHIGMIYWARPKGGKLALASAEHHDIRWCAGAE